MPESAPVTRVLRALSSDHHIRLSALDATPLWDGVRRGHPRLEAEACACLTQLLAAALLLQSRTFFSERLQMLVKGAGRAKAVVADAWPEGDIRGVLDLAEGREGDWLAAPGLLQVMRSNPAGQPYIGTLELVEGSLERQVEAYLQQSEQVQASCTLWCDPATGEAGGLLVEPLPGCPSERLQALVDALEGLEVVPLWERDAPFLARWVNGGDGAEILASTEMHYRCRCSKASLLETLAAFPPERVAELFRDRDAVEVQCDYCDARYRIAPEELGAAHA